MTISGIFSSIFLFSTKTRKDIFLRRSLQNRTFFMKITWGGWKWNIALDHVKLMSYIDFKGGGDVYKKKLASLFFKKSWKIAQNEFFWKPLKNRVMMKKSGQWHAGAACRSPKKNKIQSTVLFTSWLPSLANCTWACRAQMILNSASLQFFVDFSEIFKKTLFFKYYIY